MHFLCLEFVFLKFNDFPGFQWLARSLWPSNYWQVGVMIMNNPLECFFRHQISRSSRYNIHYSCDWSQEIFIMHVLIQSSTHWSAFYTVKLHCQTPPLKPACKEGRQFVQFLWWSLVWLDQGPNPWPTPWEADMLIIEPSQRVRLA